MKHIAAILLSALMLSAPLGGAAAEQAPGRLVVVELYTSQGCSSCPPADALLGALAGREGILALSFHVDYWDYIGWRDPFGSPEATARQRAYARTLGNPYIYTPQIIVNGRRDVVGSRAGQVESLIAEAARAPVMVPVRLRRIPRNRLAVTLDRAPGVRLAEVWLVEFDEARETDIPRGENRGRTLTYHHVVRRLERLEDYRGRRAAFEVELSGGEDARYGAAVIVQGAGRGPILGAGVSFLSPQSRAEAD